VKRFDLSDYDTPLVGLEPEHAKDNHISDAKREVTDGTGDNLLVVCKLMWGVLRLSQSHVGWDEKGLEMLIILTSRDAILTRAQRFDDLPPSSAVTHLPTTLL
jgi:hypothetical protein